MIKNLPSNRTNKEYQLEYYNPIGLLFKEHIFLHENNKLLEFDIQEIKRIFFKKERNLKQNYLLLTLAFPLLMGSFFLNSNFELLRYSGYGLSVALLIFAVIKKTYQYKIALFTKHSHYFSIPVNEEYKDDACELISLTKAKIKKNKLYLKAS
ncbi:hypothetical protein [Flavobacterium sp. XGLA_31]|uniref:hypothetical protein n=1 Tax=Flavobacterium sp. XGLA_31 TaxID=3447666 RepID=UPI003F3CA13F